MSQALELKASVNSQPGVIFLFSKSLQIILHHLRILSHVLDTPSPGDQRPGHQETLHLPPPLRGGGQETNPLPGGNPS